MLCETTALFVGVTRQSAVLPRTLRRPANDVLLGPSLYPHYPQRRKLVHDSFSSFVAFSYYVYAYYLLVAAGTAGADGRRWV